MKALQLAAAAVILAGCAGAGNGEDTKVMSPLDSKIKGIDGKDLDLSKFKGKVVLVVNVASKCGYTKQYQGLEELYEKYEKAGLVVLGVPANDYGAQEPGTDADIVKFCTTNYKVTFPMTTKVVVKGADKTDLYKSLVAATPDKKTGKAAEVGWNFEKFLIGRDGTVVGRFKSGVAPDSDELIAAIKAELEKK